MRPKSIQPESCWIGPVILLLLLLCAMLSSCAPSENRAVRRMTEPTGLQTNTARLNLFLNLEEAQGPSIRLQIDSIDILVHDFWLSLNSETINLDSVAIGDGQLFLAGIDLQPGFYNRLRMSISKAEFDKGDGQKPIVLTQPLQIEIDISGGLNLSLDESKTLLIVWDVENSLQEDNTFSPQFYAAPALRQLPVNILFVSCPDIKTVFIVRVDKNWVVDSFGLKGRPTSMAFDRLSGRRLLYTLVPNEKMIHIIDISSQRIIDSFPTLNMTPSYMTVSDNGQWAFLVHERSGYVSRMNLRNGQIEQRVLLGPRPHYITYLPSQKLVAVSLAIDQQVLLLDPETLNIVKRISTGSKPEGVIVSENQIYIAESGNATVLIEDLAGQRGQQRLMAGIGPRRMIDTDNQILVSNYVDGSLSALMPGVLGVVQKIYGLGRPLEMVFDDDYGRLFVTDEQNAAIWVLDTNSNQVIGKISLGSMPFGLVGVQ